ncbi:GDP-mannose 4,6-dehydratase, partial [bacterium]|nr:GDP-mannose 4,6-dehydratase [bacterium]
MAEKNICFVTGGAGFIGSHLCEALLRDKRIVVTLDNFDPFYDPAIKERNIDSIKKMMREENIEASHFRLIEGDIRNIELLRNIFSELKHHDEEITILHIAAKAGVRPSIENAPLYT